MIALLAAFAFALTSCAVSVIDWQFGPLPAIHDGQTASNPSYHHTTQDTFDKMSAKSLQVGGDVAATLVR